MNHLSNKANVMGRILILNAWPQLLTMTAFMVAISIRFPLWFVRLSAVVIVAAIIYVRQCLAAQSRISRSDHDPVLAVVLICSGLASIGLSLKWGTVENQLKLAPPGAGRPLILDGSHPDGGEFNTRVVERLDTVGLMLSLSLGRRYLGITELAGGLE
jgi:hypothetical protein